MQVVVTDAQGAELVKDLVQVDGKDHFAWRLGLVPGSYALNATLMGKGGRAALPVQVPAPGPEPEVVEVQLERR